MQIQTKLEVISIISDSFVNKEGKTVSYRKGNFIDTNDELLSEVPIDKGVALENVSKGDMINAVLEFVKKDKVYSIRLVALATPRI